MKRATILLMFCAALAAGQSIAEIKDRVRAVRDAAKQEDPIPRLAAYARDPSLDVRLEAVKRLNEIGGPRAIPALVTFAADPDPEIQMCAVDGLVDVFLPGYLKTAVSRTVSRSADNVKARFTDPGDLVIDGYVRVAPEAITAITGVLEKSKSLPARADAARALGVLRASSAVPQLSDALRSKDDQLMLESVVALQKIRDVSAGPRVAFLVRDLNEKIQIAALRTTGILRAQSAAPSIRKLIDDGQNPRVTQEAVIALAMIGEPPDRGIFLRYLTDKNSALRGAAAEGLARLKNPADVDRLQKAFNDESEFGARLSMAFALANLGKLEISDFSPYRYLINGLDRASFRGVALGYLAELAREPGARLTLYPQLERATVDEKTGLCMVFAESGAQDSVAYLNKLKDDANPSVAQTCLRSLRTLEARLK